MADGKFAGPEAQARWVLAVTVPIVIGGIAASAAGLLVASTYESETANWAGQAIGQDAVNLVVFPLMLMLAWRVGRGSMRAYVVWLGALAYTAYSYLLYAGFVHFSGWFLVYVFIFGLSTWGLVAGVAVLDARRLRGALEGRGNEKLVGGVLIVLGGMFALLWLSEIIPAKIAGTVPQGVVQAGLATNPVWVLDLGLVLPAMIVAGLLLRRRRPVGYLLAGPLLAFGALMGVAIIGMLVALGLRGETVAVVPTAMIALTVAAETAMLGRMLRGLPAGTTLATVIRQRHGDSDVATVPDGGIVEVG